MSNSSLHALIIGGGIAGPTLALFLKKIGMTSTVYEAHSLREDIGGGFQISPNGMKVLDKIGIAKKIAEAGYYSPTWRFLDPQGKVLVRFQNGRIERYGQPAVALSRSTFHKILMEEVEKQAIRMEYQKRLSGITYKDNTKVIAHFADGTSAEGDFLVGADGVWSATRNIVFPEAPKPSYTRFIGLGGFVPQAAVPDMTHEDRNCMNMVFGAEGAFGFCKSSEDSVMWWCHLVSEKELSREELAAIPTEKIRQDLLNLYKGWPEPVGSLLRKAPDTIKTNIYEIPSLPRWYKNRVVLIGDAAHAMNPTAGQGASTSLEDAMYLAKLLRQSPDRLEKVFAEFEQQRRPRVEKIIAKAQSLSKDKKPAGPVVTFLRNKFMTVFFTLFGERMMDELYAYKIEWNEPDRVTEVVTASSRQ
jgi:2-polyprenyl-6-methoxyphenol hydroxylase-like FAD-dependent oxidoreductase